MSKVLWNRLVDTLMTLACIKALVNIGFWLVNLAMSLGPFSTIGVVFVTMVMICIMGIIVNVFER